MSNRVLYKTTWDLTYIYFQIAGQQFNASLFWSILAVILCLALVMVGILIYYCCPGLCGCCCEEW